MVIKKALARDNDAVVKTVRELDGLQRQVAETRAELIQLRQAVADAENRLSQADIAGLVEANEQLAFTALRAQSDADAYALALEEVSRSAGHDPLTELPNRVLLLDRFAQAIASARRNGTGMALLFVDLDNFKQINDTLGHAVGDEVLKLVAKRLTHSVRDVDTVSRHGGDEFLILLTEMSSVSDAIHIAEKVIAMLAIPSRVGDHVVRLAASIGISIYPDDGEDVHTLIDRADTAMYLAKGHGLGSFAFHGGKPANERSLQSSILPSLQLTRLHPSPETNVRTQAGPELREANEQPLLAALNALELRTVVEQAQRRQKESMAFVAHQVRNPLASIRLASEMLGMVNADQLPRYRAIIEHEVEHLSRLARGLTDASGASGKVSLERRQVDMTGLIDEAVDACRPAMDTRLQHLKVQVPPQALVLHGDPVRLAQVLMNLLDNASKYTPNGGKIEFSVVTVADAIEMTISDTGIGITADALPRIFEPFVQDLHAVSFNGGGLGIGLTVVRDLVEAHGGTVTADSAGSGLGSRFVVTLPPSGRAS